MGLGLVLLFWAFVGTLLACIGAATLGGATSLFTRKAASGRKRVIITAAFFPFLCLAWGAGVFVFQGIVNEGLLHRDLGLGDTWHAPLPKTRAGFTTQRHRVLFPALANRKMLLLALPNYKSPIDISSQKQLRIPGHIQNKTAVNPRPIFFSMQHWANERSSRITRGCVARRWN